MDEKAPGAVSADEKMPDRISKIPNTVDQKPVFLILIPPLWCRISGCPISIDTLYQILRLCTMIFWIIFLAFPIILRRSGDCA